MSVASSDANAAQVDELQYGLDSGPCLTALRHGGKCASTAWPPHAAVGEYGVRRWPTVWSSLSMPLFTPDRPVGAFSLYSDGLGRRRPALRLRHPPLPALCYCGLHHRRHHDLKTRILRPADDSLPNVHGRRRGANHYLHLWNERGEMDWLPDLIWRRFRHRQSASKHRRPDRAEETRHRDRLSADDVRGPDLRRDIRSCRQCGLRESSR